MNESVGDLFNVDHLLEARDVTFNVISEAFDFIEPGITEDELKLKIIRIQKKHGVDKSWHAPQVRFGVNTVLPYGVPGIKNLKLNEDDILFLDLGLIYKDHEGDVGRPYSIGDNLEMKKCCQDVEIIWNLVREQWFKTGASGAELYTFAAKKAEELGWVLSLKKANGHRISDFPHAAKFRSTIESLNSKPLENRWILEIQIIHPSGSFGAFYEDLLN
jgi:Xaa-Pro aminopeptidase